MSTPSTEEKTLDLFQPPNFVHRVILPPLRLLFDTIWHFLRFVGGAVIVGGILVNVVISLATTGTPGLADPTTWVVSRPILTYPTYTLASLAVLLAIGLFSYVVHRASHTGNNRSDIDPEIAKEFGLSLVQQATPTPSMIPFYRPAVYLPRRLKDTGADADAQARQALSAAMARANVERYAGQVGLCVVGRNLLGTTRLAWEALQAERSLVRWLFVRWPENAHRYVDLWSSLKQHNAKIVLWLDDLSKFRDERDLALIARIPYDLEEKHIPFIIVATLPDDASAAEARNRFGDLLDHLAQLRLSDLTLNEARLLVAELTKGGDSVTLDDHFDGTPGSVVLAVNRMRDEVYPRLSTPAKIILRTIKLLRTAGIRDYTLERVLSISTTLFARTQSDWTPHLDGLRAAGFLRQTVIDNGTSVLLEPIADVYLDVAVPEYAGPTPPVDDWQKLQESLIVRHDASALVRLGNAFRRIRDDDHAETCYRRALDDLTRGTAERDWASAQFGLGDVISRRVETVEIAHQRKLLEQAEEAFKNALVVVTRESDPSFWAEIQNKLAGVVRHEATTTVGRTRRVSMLDNAAASCREALRILRRETEPEEWAEAQQNLGLVLLTHAQFAQEANTRRRMLDGAIDALTQSLSVFSPDNHPYRWAKGRRYLGDASRLRAEASNRANKENLLRQAVGAYTDALTSKEPIALWTPAQGAEILASLSTAAHQLGLLLSETSSRESLARAAETAKAAAELYAGLGQSEASVSAYRLLSTIEFERANRAETDAIRIALLDASIQANIQVQAILGRTGARDFRAQIRLDLARLYWDRVTFGGSHPQAIVLKDVEETVRYAEQSLDYYDRDRSTSEYRLASRLQRDARRKAAAMAVQVTVPIGKPDDLPWPLQRQVDGDVSPPAV